MDQSFPVRASDGPQELPDGVPVPLAVGGPGSGWEILRDCPLGGGGPRVDFVLLHWRFGVVLVSDEAATPGEARPEDRLRRALEAGRFPAIFGGLPRILGVVVPPGTPLADVARAVSAGLARSAPVELPGGDAWLGAARRAAEAEASALAEAPRRSSGRFRARRARWRWTAAAGAAGLLGCAGVLAWALLASAGQDATPAEADRAAAGGKPPALPAPPAPEALRAFAGQDATPAEARWATRSESDAILASSPAPEALPVEADSPALAAAPLDGSGDEAPPLSELPAAAPPDVAAAEAVAAAPGPPQVPVGAEEDGASRDAPAAGAPVVDAGPGRRAAAVGAEPRPGRVPAAGGPAPATPAAKAGAAPRCSSIVAKAQLGEPLTERDRGHLRHGC